MKRLAGLALMGPTALTAAFSAILAGCPVYSDDSSGPVLSCEGYGCGPYGYVDGGNGPSNDATVPSSCSQPGDCPEGYTCGSSGVCQLGGCSVTGCVAGYVCELENGTLTCVSEGSVPDSGTQTTPDTGTADTGSQNDAGSVACQSNSDCTSGSLCLDGTCVPPGDQCYDGTQCPAGDKCVQGACTPSCSPSEDGGPTSCPTGYACTEIDDASTSGVCTGNPTPCESNPSVCPSGTVCSQNHCVAACGTGGACPAGEECVQGGCVPNQNPQFTCMTDGVQDACASGSICIHHSCYIACNPEAGASACQSADQFNECKPVTASGSTYYVCGSSTNLGTECNPTDGQLCSSSAAVCIDGYCY
jgi:hypothetical protein